MFFLLNLGGGGFICNMLIISLSYNNIYKNNK